VRASSADSGFAGFKYDESVAEKSAVRRVGLARALSKLGYCSRSQATKLIRAGRVRLNEKESRNPEVPVNLERDRIAVDHRAVHDTTKIYLMMNKPRGLVTTASDEKGRETVYNLLARSRETGPWVAPVGRLDKASEGLLLLTNDSEWAARVTAPETHLQKRYHVQVGSPGGDRLAMDLMIGVKSEAEVLRAEQARLLRTGEKNCWLEITLDEGKNRQIRRMLAGLDVEVLRLVRVAIGPLQLGTLTKGAYRSLTKEEKQLLDQAMNRTSRRNTREVGRAHV
jgi:23S rRNA pseudouridine2605 synthase